jgi:nucleoside-diphosphate-sugar epimerase
MSRGGRVLVTGAGGFVGSHAVDALVAAGWRVRALVRRTSSRRWLEGLPIEFAVADVRREDELLAACRDCDAVVHAAGITNARHPRDYFEVNARGTERLWQAARQAGTSRFLLVSSLAAAGPSRDSAPQDETAPPRPVSAYGESKLAAERVVLEGAARGEMEAVVARPPAVYGPRDSDILPLVLAARYGVFPMLTSGRREVALVHALDLAAGLRLALEKAPSGGVYFFTDGAVHTLPEVGRVIAETHGRRVLTIPVPRWAIWAAALAGEAWSRLRRSPATLNLDRARQLSRGGWTASDRRAREELGYRSERDLPRGMRETIEWYRRTGWI